ncbi:sensor histidine kinase [Pseudopedobacter beijingensis]|uniref:histidine kinase n=1 Tax=Pseudopedobacter beijingensis TaxID=1207056 RepID=A0ABW4IDM3_9SPHI
MGIRQKLSLRSTFIFAITLSFVVFGTYLLFKYHTEQMYNRRLFERARIAAYFYLEKDEMNEGLYTNIEEQFRRISKESIRLYHASDKKIYVDDTLSFSVPDAILDKVASLGAYNTRIDGRQVVCLFYKDNQGDFIVVASGVDETAEQQLVALRWMLLIFCVLGLIIHYFLTSILANRTFKPFSKIITKVNAIKPEDLSVRLDVPEGNPDEIKNLITTFNYFLERLDRSMMIQRNFLKNASHELKTPLAVLIGEIEIALNQPRSNEEYRDFLLSMKRDGLHLKSIIEGLLTLSSLEMPTQHQMNKIMIDEILWEVLDKKQIEYKDLKVSVDLKDVAESQELLVIHGNKDLLFVAINNIIDNAIKFSYPEPIKINAEVADGKLVLKIIDQGPGIEEKEQEKIFELFYRSKPNNHVKGYGIGLYLTKQILDLHHIDIAIESKRESGTEVSITFP